MIRFDKAESCSTGYGNLELYIVVPALKFQCKRVLVIRLGVFSRIIHSHSYLCQIIQVCPPICHISAVTRWQTIPKVYLLTSQSQQFLWVNLYALVGVLTLAYTDKIWYSKGDITVSLLNIVCVIVGICRFFRGSGRRGWDAAAPHYWSETRQPGLSQRYILWLTCLFTEPPEINSMTVLCQNVGFLSKRVISC